MDVVRGTVCSLAVICRGDGGWMLLWLLFLKQVSSYSLLVFLIDICLLG